MSSKTPLIEEISAYLRVSPFQLAPVWVQIFWCIVAVNVVQLAWNLECLLRKIW
jgi:hypothetical protein